MLLLFCCRWMDFIRQFLWHQLQFADEDASYIEMFQYFMCFHIQCYFHMNRETEGERERKRRMENENWLNSTLMDCNLCGILPYCLCDYSNNISSFRSRKKILTSASISLVFDAFEAFERSILLRTNHAQWFDSFFSSLLNGLNIRAWNTDGFGCTHHKCSICIQINVIQKEKKKPNETRQNERTNRQ